ncbi:S8 family peptidase [Luteimonas sp. RC10]|uniref:S8 family peptidase n=1 Tax=Luteimonas sp. RC10 TaxID=2587035 RepID=UPI0017CCD33D|nr:S8 family peptidase [Luteimonas sp. RC10]MBB3343665.1 serine protease [Luteimonas sp. RC10]
MNKTSISLALAAILAGTFGAQVADAARIPARIVPRIDVAPPAEAASDRIVVRYAQTRIASTDRSGKLQIATAAIRRAGLERPAAAGRAAKALPALQVGHLRTTAVGFDVLRLSRPLPARDLQALVTELAADPAVASVHVDRRMRATGVDKRTVSPQLTPNDEFFASHQWHLQGSAGAINVANAWDRSTGAGIVVAVLDTGILAEHPDFADNILPGYDFITDPFVSRRDTADRVPGALDHGDWNPVAGECYSGSPVIDSTWHGTHVAGTVAEATHNGIGGAGVAYDAQVLPVRVLGRCGGYDSDIADAIVWASGGEVDGVPANTHPAEIINLSLGGQGQCEAMTQAAIDDAVARGSVVVVAAGNYNDDAQRYSPANCNNVITVGANRINSGRAYYSNFGAVVDVSGPGGGGEFDTGNGGWNGYVLQTGYDGKTTPTSGQYLYTGLMGTSMAAPHVSGIAALVQSALVAQDRPPMTPADMEILLKRTARPFNVPPPANTPIGVGIVDATRALEKALETPCDPATETCELGTQLFNGADVTGLASTGEGALFRFEAQAGHTLTLMTLAGRGDVTLHARYGAPPTASAYEFRSARAGSNIETIRITAPKAGTYYLQLSGSYTGLTVVARQ